jgi:phospholipid/cholesterol/gamma-HCH transport system substrate-binding protein
VAQQRSTEIKVGIFVLICLLLAAVMVIRFGKYTRVAAKTYQIEVVFPNVGGIVRDANVMLGGIAVGKVRTIQLKEDKAVRASLTLAIYEGVTIRKDARFVINQAGLLGDRYVDVIPGGTTAEPIKTGDVVEGTTSVDLSEAIRSVVDVLKQAATTIERVDKAIQRIDEVALNTQSLMHVSSTLANVDAATSNVVQLTAGLRDVVEENRGRVDDTLAGFSEASERMSSAAQRTDDVVKRVDELIAKNQADIHTAIKNLAGGTERLNNLLSKLERGEGTLGKLLTDPSLHDEVLELVQNWRRRGILYKEPSPREEKRGRSASAGRAAEAGEGQLIFGTDLTKPAR